MTKKEYLAQYRRCLAMIDDAEADLKTARTRAEGLSAIRYSDMPKSKKTARDLSEAVAVLEAAAERYRRTVTKCADTMELVEMSIETAPTLMGYKVLRLRYISGLKWDEIAERCGKSRPWVATVHGRALEKIKMY